MKKQFIVYDGRARASGNTDDATAMCTAETLEEAMEDRKMYDDDSIVAEYDDDGKGNLTNEQLHYEKEVD